MIRCDHEQAFSFLLQPNFVDAQLTTAARGMTPSRVRIRNIVLGSLAGAMLLLIAMLVLSRSAAPACADSRPGLWLQIADGEAHLTGRAPAMVRVLASEVAVAWWGYPSNRLCSDGTLFGQAWSDVVEAVYRSPLANLRRGTVLVRPDVVVVTGQTSSRAARTALESEVRSNLARAGLATLPLLFEVAVTVDPRLPPRLAALTIRFPTAGLAPSEQTLRELDHLIHDLRSSDGMLVVTGHADSSGRASVNEAIAQLRAEAVRDALIRRGIPSARIQAIGFGARLPAASNLLPEGRAANRRVEIRLEPEPAQTR